eukprot:PRCOL_00001057-RA
MSGPDEKQGLDELEFSRSACSLAQRGQTSRLAALLDRRPQLLADDGTLAAGSGGSGYTPLHYAARAGHLDAVELLLSRGARVDAATTAGGATALHRAAYMGHVHVCAALLAAGADAGACDADGQTPLHKSAAQGRTEAFALLSEACPGAHSTADRRGATPRDLLAPPGAGAAGPPP